VVHVEVRLKGVSVGEDLVDVNAPRKSICLIRDESDATRLSTILAGESGDHRSKFVGSSRFRFKDGEKRSRLGTIDAGADDDAAGVFEGAWRLFGHRVTLVPGSTIRTVVPGANRAAASM
jgi:hypothetical protein